MYHKNTKTEFEKLEEAFQPKGNTFFSVVGYFITKEKLQNDEEYSNLIDYFLHALRTGKDVKRYTLPLMSRMYNFQQIKAQCLPLLAKKIADADLEKLEGFFKTNSHLLLNVNIYQTYDQFIKQVQPQCVLNQSQTAKTQEKSGNLKVTEKHPNAIPLLGIVGTQFNPSVVSKQNVLPPRTEIPNRITSRRT